MSVGMNASPEIALRRPLLAFTNAFDPKPVTVIYAIGVVFWVALTLVFGLDHREDVALYTVIEAFGSAWQTAFLWSLGVVALTSAIYCIAQKKSLLAVVVNTMIFAAPFALFLLNTLILDEFYYQHPATVEMTKLFGPIFMLFYVFGIFYMWWRSPGGREEALPAFMLSTTVVAVLMLALTSFKLFLSNDYIYRNAFEIRIEKVDRQGNTAQVEGVLTINKPGSYTFSVVGNEMAFHPNQIPQTLTVDWADKAGVPSQVGEYKFHLTVPEARPVRPMLPQVDSEEIYPQGPEACLQVSLSAKEGKSATFIKSLPIWLEEF